MRKLTFRRPCKTNQKWVKFCENVLQTHSNKSTKFCPIWTNHWGSTLPCLSYWKFQVLKMTQEFPEFRTKFRGFFKSDKFSILKETAKMYSVYPSRWVIVEPNVANTFFLIQRTFYQPLVAFQLTPSDH